ncbi:uncharacterized protein LOC62_05G006916 [Vanrija pseudolonga]|uniref:Uncharacterized protein n=1 Tax=Vanrija pseudolonga TaxID=143232 RepID=A0AAF0YB11_9TREE|nr:hypothetical protein LOC62_05G006916 [Vanrija pseudolonga]
MPQASGPLDDVDSLLDALRKEFRDAPHGFHNESRRDQPPSPEIPRHAHETPEPADGPSKPGPTTPVRTPPVRPPSPPPVPKRATDTGRLSPLGSDDGWGPPRATYGEDQDRSQHRAQDVDAWRTAIPATPDDEGSSAAPPPAPARSALRNEPRLRRHEGKTPKPRLRAAPKTPAPQSTKPAPVLVEGSRPVRHAMEEIVARLKNENERRGQESPSTRSPSALASPSVQNGSSVARGVIMTPRGLEPPRETEDDGWPSPPAREANQGQGPATPALETSEWPAREETPALVVTDIEVAPGSRPDEIASEWSRRGVVESVEIVKVVARVVWRPFHE